MTLIEQRFAAAQASSVDIARTRLRSLNEAGIGSQGHPNRHARALDNCGHYLADLGRLEDAYNCCLSALGIVERLSEIAPDAYGPDLANCLSNLGKHAHALNRLDEAEQFGTRAVDMYSRLCNNYEGSFPAHLARSFANLGVFLSELDRTSEALHVTQWAVTTCRELFRRNPRVHEPLLASTLSNLGVRLSECEKYRDAALTLMEVVRRYRRLAAARSDMYTPLLAVGMCNLAMALEHNGRIQRAQRWTERAIRTLLPFFRSLPQAYAAWMEAFVYSYRARASLAGIGIDEALIAPIESECRLLEA